MVRPSSPSRHGRLLVGTLVLLGAASAARGQTSLTWTGLGTDTNWTDVGNWGGSAYPNNGQPTGGSTYNATLNGSPTLNANITINNFTFSGGLISGGSNLTVNNVLSWSGGSFGGSGTITLNGGGSISGTPSLNQSLNNTSGSVVTLTSTNALYSGSPGGTWTNQAGSTFTFSGDGGLYNNAVGSFNNAGLFQKTGGTSTSYVYWNFTNTGTINATSGTLTFNGTTNTQSAAITIGPNSAVAFSSGTTTWTGTAGSTGSGTIQLNGASNLFNGTNALASNVALSAGAIDGTGSLSISGPLAWSGGTMQGAGTTTLTGGASISGSPTLARTLINASGSTATVSGTTALYSNSPGGTWTNQAGSIFTFSGDGDLYNNAVGTFNNAGLFQKTGGTNTSYVYWNFTNTGTINATSGTLNFAGTTNTQSAAITVGGGATVAFSSGATTWTGSAGSTGAGTIQLNGASNLFNGTNTLASNVAFSAGNIDGTGSLTINGPLAWSGGTMQGAGTTTLTGGASISGSPALARTLINASGSTATVSGTTALYSNSPGGAWTNQAGSTFTFSGDGDLYNNATGTFNNAGLIQKTGGTNTSYVSWNFTNTGTINATSGTLNFTGTTNTQSAAITVGPNGAVAFSSGATTWTGSAGSAGAGTIQINGASNLFNGTNTLASNVAFSAGNVDGTGSLTISGPLAWSGGTMQGAGTTTLTGGASISGSPALARTLINASGSTATVSGTTALYSNSPGGAWTNQAGSTFTFSGDGDLYNNATGTFNNAGLIQKTGGTNHSYVYWNFTNTGTVLAASGTLSLGTSSNLTNYSSGTLTGGTWRVLAGATLDFGSQTISTIAAGTTVELNGSGSLFPDVENHVTTNAGSLNILGGRTFTPGGTLANTGVLTVGQKAGDGSQLTGSVTVSGGGSLRGTGTVSGTATIGASGSVSPGAAITVGTLAAGQWIFQTGGTDVLKYNPVTTTPVAGADNDTITSGSGQLNLSALSSSNRFSIDLVPEFAATPAGSAVTYTAGTFSSVVLPGGVTASNLTSLFTFTGNYSGTPTASLDNTEDKLQFTFTPASLTPWTWTGTTSGSWSVGTNWSPTGPPPSNVATALIFGATSNATMTNDIAGTFTLNSMTFNSGSPAFTLAGNGLNFVSNGSGGALPTLVSNSSNSVAINVPLTLTNNLTVSGSGNVTLGGAIGGAGSLTMSGFGTLALGTANTYTGGTNVLSGTVQAPSDAALGTGNVTGASGGTLSFTGSTATTKSFAMNYGTITVASGQTVTFNGSQVSNATLDGGGTFATAATGALFDNSTSTASVAIASNSAKDQFVHFTNSAVLTFAGGLNSSLSTAISNLNGFTNEGAGVITVGPGSAINAANFQSYGTLTLVPNTTGAPTVFTNTGTAAMGFNGGSRTFIGTPATADPTGQNIVDYLDLHGHNAIVAGGLFVNNGGVYDTSGAGTATIIADYNALVKGAGFYQNTVKTQNGGKFQTGNSPGITTFGTLIYSGPAGNTGTSSYIWQIDDAGPSSTFPTAPGQAGGTSAQTGSLDFGWSLNKAVHSGPSLGNFTWNATPTDKFTIELQTLTPATTVGSDIQGPMGDFDPTLTYVWPLVTYVGTYTGPTTDAALNASTTFDTSSGPFANPTLGGTFAWHLDQVNQALDLVYTPSPIPEPGTLALTGLAAVMGVYVRRRRAVRAA